VVLLAAKERRVGGGLFHAGTEGLLEVHAVEASTGAR
jgi:hypothetical protein